jgi:heme exporter protein C
VMVALAPYESTMGFVQKIFYFHFPSAMAMFGSALICGIASAWYLFGGRPKADHLAAAAAELTVVFGVIVLVSGPLWARKAWGVWWQWDARLTSTLIMWLIFVAYLLLRRYGGPGSERLAAGVALFGMVNVPFVYWSVNVWRTVHPLTSVVPTLPPALRTPLWFCTIAFLGLLGLLLSLRTKLEARRSELDALYLSAEEKA